MVDVARHRTFVLDTSVLLADPHALRRFDEHEVVLPVVVLLELEGKRAHPELGYFARQALRLLGARPSKSAEAALARSIEELRAMPVRDRMLLALRLGRRDRELREAFAAPKSEP